MNKNAPHAALILATIAIAVGSTAANAQQPESARLALAPPVDHESGVIEQVIIVSDAGYRSRGYVVKWRNSRIFVTDASEELRSAGDTVPLLVNRYVDKGIKRLRFSIGATAAPSSWETEQPGDESGAITAGTAKVEETLGGDDEGYRFEAYVVTWHGSRIVVVGSASKSALSPGDTIDFRVLKTSIGDDRHLSFSM